MNKKVLLVLSTLLFSLNAFAEIIWTPNTAHIDRVQGSVSGAGDFVIQFNTGEASCLDGVYIENTGDAKFENAVAIAISAFMGGRQIRAYIYNDVLWPGSSNQDYCKVRVLRAE